MRNQLTDNDVDVLGVRIQYRKYILLTDMTELITITITLATFFSINTPMPQPRPRTNDIGLRAMRSSKDIGMYMRILDKSITKRLVSCIKNRGIGNGRIIGKISNRLIKLLEMITQLTTVISTDLLIPTLPPCLIKVYYAGIKFARGKRICHDSVTFFKK